MYEQSVEILSRSFPEDHPQLLGARSKLDGERRVLLAQTVLESSSYIAPGSD